MLLISLSIDGKANLAVPLLASGAAIRAAGVIVFAPPAMPLTLGVVVIARAVRILT